MFQHWRIKPLTESQTSELSNLIQQNNKKTANQYFDRTGRQESRVQVRERDVLAI